MAGDLAVTWYGPEPRVIVNDPKLMREILANKHGVFGKQKSVLWIERLLANGLTTHQGEKWATHRRIINHAFHLEKLKVTSLHTNSIYIYIFFSKGPRSIYIGSLSVGILSDSLQYY
jgi:hypothetical protein